MNKILLLVLIVALRVSAFASDSIPVAVLPWEIPQAPESAINNLTESLRAEVAATGRFRVVNREIDEKAYKQYLFRFTDLHKKQQEQRKAAPADSIIFKGVSKLIWGKINQVGQLYVINLRLVNVSTSKVEQMVSYKHKGKRDQLPEGIKQAVAALVRGLGPSESTATGQ